MARSDSQDSQLVLAQMRAEIVAMLRHALATGRPPPPALLQNALAALGSPGAPWHLGEAPSPGQSGRSGRARDVTHPAAKVRAASSIPDQPAADETTAGSPRVSAADVTESVALAESAEPEDIADPAIALEPSPAPAAESSVDVVALARVHAHLAALVSPARPGTLRLMHGSRRDGVMPLLGPLRNVRWLTLAAFGCLLGFMAVAQSHQIDGGALSDDPLSLDGWQQLTVSALLLTSAGLGATFQALFTAQAYVSRATYDPLYDSSYWIRIGLGLVSGLMLAVLVPINTGEDGGTLQRPLLALLGGFSARLTHRVMQRLVDTVDAMFDSDRQQLVEQTRSVAQAEAQQSAAQTRLALARQLVTVQGELLAHVPDEPARQRLSALLDGLLVSAPDVEPATDADARRPPASLPSSSDPNGSP